MKKMVLILVIVLIEVGVSIVYREAAAWTQVSSGGFGDSNNNIFHSAAGVFNGYLYVGTMNDVIGAEIWRS